MSAGHSGARHNVQNSPSNVRSNVKIGPGALVCAESELRGDITIGAKTVIHPQAKILAEGGPIIIGDSNLIEEQSVIINRAQENADGSTQSVMIIGNNNVFEVGSHCEALKIGDNNIVESKARLGRHTELTDGCIIGAMCDVKSWETLPENTVIFGSNCQRRVQADRPPLQTLQLDFLTKILPNYHHLKKASKTLPVKPV